MPPEFSRVSLEATLAPSEDPEKVLDAMRNILGEVHFALRRDARHVLMETSDKGSLNRLRDQLRDRHVRAAARRRLLAGRSGEATTTVMVNRQAATAGVVVLCDNAEESPLGPLLLTVESRNLDEVIQWLAAYETV